jgi:hypothetical protein
MMAAPEASGEICSEPEQVSVRIEGRHQAAGAGQVSPLFSAVTLKKDPSWMISSALWLEMTWGKRFANRTARPSRPRPIITPRRHHHHHTTIHT